MQIEQIEEWIGQDVVDSQGEKVGKLEDVYYEPGGSKAVLICVKSGMLGRKHRAAPLGGAQATRDHIKLAYTKVQVEEGPLVDADQDLGDEERQTIASHYGCELAPGSFESARGREARGAKADELNAEMDELEARAAKKRDEAKHGEDQAQSSAREAEDLEAERKRLEGESRRL